MGACENVMGTFDSKSSMILSPAPQPADAAPRVDSAAPGRSRRFTGKRVAMVTFSPYPHDPRPRRAVDALVGEGAVVDLICLGDGHAPGREALNGIRVLRVPLKNPRRGKFEYGCRYGAFILISAAIFAWRSLFGRYDLVYVHNMPDILVLSALLPKAFGAKVVLDLHDPMPELMKTIFRAPEESGSVRFLKHLEKWSIGRADLAIAVNIACKRLFSERSCGAEKVAVVMNSPDGTIFPFRAVQPRASGNHDGQRPFVIMYHGSLVERNGLDVAVDALVHLRETMPDAELRIFGSATPFLERVMEEARRKNVDGMVRYLGARRLEELVAEISDCDLGVIPNHRNAFTDINTPTRIFEYLALGRPVVAPSTQGILDYFSREALLFFEAGDSRDLARQIEYAFLHPREVLEIVRNGQKVYLEHTWEQERQTLLARLEAVLSGK